MGGEGERGRERKCRKRKKKKEKERKRKKEKERTNFLHFFPPHLRLSSPKPTYILLLFCHMYLFPSPFPHILSPHPMKMTSSSFARHTTFSSMATHRSARRTTWRSFLIRCRCYFPRTNKSLILPIACARPPVRFWHVGA